MRRTHRFSFLLALLLMGSAPRLAAQSTLSGYVYDAETDDPLVGANVFVANTMLGAATDADGYFSISGVPLGTHELVASFLGYRSAAEPLRLRQAERLTFTFHLEAMILLGGGVEVTAADPKKWNKQREKFERFFLGVSRNAAKCTILNAEVLEFDEDEETGRFTASARAPLLIDNEALGYQLRFVLEDFELREREKYIRYRGRVGFTALRPESERQRRRWDKERERAYRGSLRHFLSAVVRDELWDEGYMLLSEEESRAAAYAGVPGGRPAARVSGVKPEQILTPGELPFERLLNFTGYLKVIYFKEMPSAAYLRLRQYANRSLQAGVDEQVSWIAVNQPDISITTEGIVQDTYAITRLGYWYFERVAELLPYEYHLPGSEPVAAPPEAPPVVDLRPDFMNGMAAFEQANYADAVQHLAGVMAADPGFSLPEYGAAAYWLGKAYAEQDRLASAHNTWLAGQEALRDAGAFEVRLADAYIQSVFLHQEQEHYEAAAIVYLDLLEQLATGLDATDAALVRRHLVQFLPVLDEAERENVLDGDPGPKMQRVRLLPGAGHYASTWWRGQDPLPSSLLNERVAEHLARVAYAVEHFGYERHPQGFDDRGAAFVQYGPPRTRASIPVDLTRTMQVLRDNAYSLPGPLVPPMNEFWAYQHVDDIVYYVFVLQDGRYQAGSPEDLVPKALISASKRVGVGHTDPRTANNPAGTQAPANQALAEALFEVWMNVYTQLAAYHPIFEDQLQELDLHESDLRASRTGGATLGMSALSFVNGVEAKFDALAREAERRLAEDAPQTYSTIEASLEPLSVSARMARFLDEDGTTRTEIYWSHTPGSLALSRRLRNKALTQGEAPPDRYLVEMVVALQSDDYRRRAPTQLSYLAADLPETASAPVQVVDLTGSKEPYHIAIQWDQFIVQVGATMENVRKGAYLRTGVHAGTRFTPLNNDPQRLELSDLKPVRLAVGQGEEDMEPYPYFDLSPETPLGLYFEVYHLAFGEGDQTRYTVEYEVVRDAGRRRAQRTSARSSYSGNDRTAREYIAIDLSTLDDAGPLDIILRVTDETTGQQVERTMSFQLGR